MSDFLVLEQQLVEHLTDKVRFQDKPVDVKSGRQVPRDANSEPVLRVPALLVTYDGYRVLETSRRKVRVGQGYSVTAVLANLRDGERLGAREDASSLLDDVIELVHGWTPPYQNSLAFKPLELTNPAYPPQYGARNAYFPLSFNTERSLKGVPSPGVTS